MASKGSFLTGGEFAWGFHKLDVVIAASRPRCVSIKPGARFRVLIGTNLTARPRFDKSMAIHWSLF